MRLVLLIVAILALVLGYGWMTLPREPAHGQVVPLWPKDAMPGTHCPRGQQTATVYHGIYHLSMISDPAVELFKVKSTVPTPAIIICPGGGYQELAYDSEGTEPATWLNSLGITAIVLRYRIPDNREGAYQDLQRAIRLTREEATSWNINPKRVGVLGFSAGGHLAARLSANYATPAYLGDSVTCRPDCTILVYPAYLNKGDHVAPEVAPHRAASMPPILIVHTENDKPYVPGSRLYDQALTAAGVRHEFLLYPNGGHGFGIRSWSSVRTWTTKAADWLKQIQFTYEN